MGTSGGRYGKKSMWKIIGALVIFVIMIIFTAISIYKGINDHDTQRIIFSSIGFVCCVVLSVLLINTMNKEEEVIVETPKPKVSPNGRKNTKRQVK